MSQSFAVDREPSKPSKPSERTKVATSLDGLEMGGKLLLLLPLAGLLVLLCQLQGVHSHRLFTFNNAWKTIDDCSSLYGSRCRRCCADFNMSAFFDDRCCVMRFCKCVPRDAPDDGLSLCEECAKEHQTRTRKPGPAS